jgi:hypothetical protein
LKEVEGLEVDITPDSVVCDQCWLNFNQEYTRNPCFHIQTSGQIIRRKTFIWRSCFTSWYFPVLDGY